MQDILEKILSLLSIKKTVFVAIDGIPGSGKTTLSRFLKKEVPKTKVIKVDEFYDPSIGNTDFERIKKEVFLPLERGEKIRFRSFDWKQNSYRKVTYVGAGGIIIIEGISSMDRRLVNLYDYKIWIECPVEIGLERVLKRDSKKYEKLWKEKWMPEILNFIELQKPHEKADFIINYKDIQI